MAKFAFLEDPAGGVGMEIVAADLASVIGAAGTALALYMWEQDRVEATETFPFSAVGLSAKTAVIASLAELLLRMEIDRLVPKRLEIDRVEEVPEAGGLKRRQFLVTGRVTGARYDPAQHRLLAPVRAALMEGMRLRACAEGLRFYCVLDV